MNYLQAWRAREELLDELEGNEIDSFALFPHLIERIEALQEMQRYPHESELVLDEEINEFQSFAMAYAPHIRAHKHLRPFVGLDGCHTRSRFRMMLLIATGIDANDQVVLLSWALVPTESTEHWTWFMQFLSKNFTCFNDQDFIFISDRDKGISIGLDEVFPKSYQAMCCQHLADNVQARYGVLPRKIFWQMARARSWKLYEEARSELLVASSEAVSYLDGIDTTRWALHSFPHARYGHDTSNISESVNKFLNGMRSFSPIKLFDALWRYTMETIHERRFRVQPGYLAAAPQKAFDERAKKAARYRVFHSGEGVFQVENLKGNKFVVDLGDTEGEPYCDCDKLGEYQAACTHTIAACLHDERDPYTYVSSYYTTAKYRKTYHEPLYPISVAGLKPDYSVKPPRFVKPRGRPKTKRIRKTQRAAKLQRCSNCQQLVRHNRRNCRAQPAQIEGSETRLPQATAEILEYRRQRMRSRRRTQVWAAEMEELDEAFEAHEAEQIAAERIQAECIQASIQREDSYEPAEFDSVSERSGIEDPLITDLPSARQPSENGNQLEKGATAKPTTLTMRLRSRRGE